MNTLETIEGFSKQKRIRVLLKLFLKRIIVNYSAHNNGKSTSVTIETYGTCITRTHL